MTYAIFRTAGFQYRAELGDVLRLPSFDVDPGETVTFDEVLLGATDGEVLVGRPTVEGASVRAEVLRHARADKIVVFKFKRRKNYRRKTGHRQGFTEVRVSEIDLGGKRRAALGDAEKPKKEAAAKARPKKPSATAAAGAKAKTSRKRAPTARAKAAGGEVKAKASAKSATKESTAEPKSEKKPRSAPKSKKKKS